MFARNDGILFQRDCSAVLGLTVPIIIADVMLIFCADFFVAMVDRNVNVEADISCVDLLADAHWLTR